ncbi:MAG: toll/interleukin-1 receptor domain-containing protein [Anaerolineae bacterium]|nr:toll/interleukin-1 receptor domain-containing protein [Anaerolineae bacterium]
MNTRQHRYRVFLSYAHVDKELVQRIASLIEAMGLAPLWDVDLNPGKPFTDEIKELIARSHVFIPIITRDSQHRPWVHQETGFAIALDIPILPITIGHVPSDMIAGIQGIETDSSLSQLREKFAEIDLDKLVLPIPKRPFGMVEIAELPSERCKLMSTYANWVLDLGEYGLVRTQAKLGSSFSVPRAPVDDPIWDEREGDRDTLLRPHQLQERLSLERHAQAAGCRLIIDPTTTKFNVPGVPARRARLRVFLDFLRSIPSDKIEVAISSEAHDTNLVVVGDHFFAESMAPRSGQGYFQTVFHSHPPSVLRKVRRFDQRFEELADRQDTTVDQAIALIEGILRQL